MEQIEKAKEALIGSIKESECYKEYEAARLFIKKDSHLKERLDTYRRMLFQYGMKRENGEAVAKEEEDTLNELYSSLMLNDKTRKFLICEQNLTELLSDLFETISENIPVDFGFLER